MNITFDVKKEPCLNIGDRVYTVYSVNSQGLREKCPVCGGKKKIMVPRLDKRGEEEIVCSYCEYRGKNDNTLVVLRNYEMKEWIVHKFIIEGVTKKAAYGTKSGYNELLSISGINAFSKSRGDNYSTINLPTNIDMYNRMDEEYTSTKYFTSKAKAEECLKELIQAEKKKLAVFNEKHGTDHKWPFPEPNI